MPPNKTEFPLSFWNTLLGSSQGRSLSLGAHGLVIDSSAFQPGKISEWQVTGNILWTRLYQVIDNVPTGYKVMLPASAYHDVKRALASLNFYSKHQQAWQAVIPYAKQWALFLGATRYIPKHEWTDFISKGSSLKDVYPVWSKMQSIDTIEGADKLFEALTDINIAALQIADANNRFVTHELAARARWFSNLKPSPSLVQREIAIRDETNCLVVAGAGTGKTSTIVSKVRYLVDSGIASEKQILAVTFNNDAAKEIRDRCGKQGLNTVEILTFHALGLRILGEIDGQKPSTLSELESDQGRFGVIKNLLQALSEDIGFAEDYAKFILLYPRPAPVVCIATSKNSFISSNKNNLKHTLRGEFVRSGEEWRIANWLFLRGVNYDYEKAYPYNHGNSKKRGYHPDFTITWTVQSDDKSNGTDKQRTVYLEHQALDYNNKPPPGFHKYAEKVEWARTFHREHNTILLESLSAWFMDGSWETKLEQLLRKAGVPLSKPRPLNEIFKEIKEDEIVLQNTKHVISLLQRGLDLSRAAIEAPDFPFTSQANSFPTPSLLAKVLDWLTDKVTPPARAEPDRHILYRRLLGKLQFAYTDYKRRRHGIDFDDMITLAREQVRKGRFKGEWTHYIVDEFQDASLARLDLILLLRRGRADSRLLCVGDDWQSIIRFAGADIRVMTEFGSRVGDHFRVDLPQTFRYTRTIADVSSMFILRNTAQISKKILPTDKPSNPIRVIFTSRNADSTINDSFVTELNRINKVHKAASVFILSRFNYSIPPESEQKRIRAMAPNLKLEWLTAHRSKGREADVVFVGDLNGGMMGFPCRRDDDPLLSPFLPPSEKYEVAEERRLFYVALTRAKSEVVLMADGSLPSAFVTELINHSRNLLDVVGQSEVKVCSACDTGVMVGRDGANGRFYSCSNSPVCTYKEEACPICRLGLLVLDPKMSLLICSNGKCKHAISPCPKCHQGTLQLRRNKSTGEEFWGCSDFNNEESPCRYTQSFEPTQNRQLPWVSRIAPTTKNAQPNIITTKGAPQPKHGAKQTPPKPNQRPLGGFGSSRYD
jgi:DNA helicase-4